MWRLLAPVLLAATVFAQATHIVDAQGGPGVHTTLAAAVAAAVPGDTILVLPTAVYDFALTTAKGLTILAGGTTPTAFRGRLTVAGLPPTERFALRGFAGQPPPQSGSLEILQCAGEVTLEELELWRPPAPPSSTLGALTIDGSAQVSLHRCTCLGTGGDTTLLVASRVGASDSLFGSLQGTSLAVLGGEVLLTGCRLGGTLVLSWGNGPPTVTMAGGSVIGLGPYPYAVHAQLGTLRIDSLVVLGGVVQGTVVAYESGRVQQKIAPPGASSVARFDGPTGAFGALAIGLPAPPLPTPLGDLWLDGQAHVVIALGAVPLQAGFTTPLQAPFAASLVAQGVLLHQGTLRLSGPVRALVP